VTGSVVVVGSIHLDVQVEVPRLPRPGETVLGRRHRRSPGGKGANQAVAAAISGQPVTFVGRVGDDQEGRVVRAALATRGVDVGYVCVGTQALTGAAFITVDEAGANQIAVSPGASGRLNAADVARARDAIATARVLLLQLEVPLETVRAAIQHVSDRTTVVLNPAPARDLPLELLRSVDVLVPNLVELRQLSGEPDLLDVDDIGRAARSLPGDMTVVVTLGSDGALLVDGTHAHHIRAEPVDAVDTTGAGDAFCGALASAIARGESLDAAVKSANHFAAQSTRRHGALSSYIADDIVGND
jgi:ribokinase